MITYLALTGTAKSCVVIYMNEHFEIKSYQVNKSIKQVLKFLAEQNFVSFEGNLKLISKKYNFKQKTPLLIQPGKILFFPTTSLDKEDCIVLNYYCVDSYKKIGDDTKIQFCTTIGKHKVSLDYDLIINFDRRTIKNQIQRCAIIEKDLIKEKNTFDDIILMN